MICLTRILTRLKHSSLSCDGIGGTKKASAPVNPRGLKPAAHHRITILALVLSVPCVFPLLSTRAADIVYPVADGTLADGGGLGGYDGIADGWNWMFGPVGFAGAVTLATETPGSAVEHRIVCEYDLRGVSLTTPLDAALTFTIRGASVFPFPDVTLHVYSYPADLIELPGDFSAQPVILQGAFTVMGMQAPRTETLDVTELVKSALLSGDKRVAFRFQIDPETPYASNQVFIDALDTEPATKPFLIIRSAVPGDADDDGDVDLDDFAILTDCLAGPGAPPEPTIPGVTATDCLCVFDRDADADVDLDDFSRFLGPFARE